MRYFHCNLAQTCFDQTPLTLNIRYACFDGNRYYHYQTYSIDSFSILTIISAITIEIHEPNFISNTLDEKSLSVKIIEPKYLKKQKKNRYKMMRKLFATEISNQ